MADNDNTDEREKHRAELGQREFVCVLNDDETYSDLHGAWIAFSPSGDGDTDTDEAIKEIPEDDRIDLHGLVMFAINQGFFDEPNCDGDYLVKFQRKNGETYSIHFDADYLDQREADTEAKVIEAAINEVSHERIERHLAGKIGGEAGEPQDDYPDDLNLDPATITCRRLITDDKLADVHADIHIG